MTKNLNINELKKNLDKDYFISASAGTGKTYTITKYYLSILEKFEKENYPDIVQNILAVTFTNKAAGEMKERILEEVDKKLEENKNYKYWRQIKTNLNRAWITTIDSFCSKILRENNIAIGVDPNFTIINELKMEIEIEKSVYNTLKILFQLYEDNNRNIEELISFLPIERRETVKIYINELLSDLVKFNSSLKYIIQELNLDIFKKVLSETLQNWRTEMKKSELPEIELINKDFNDVLWLFKISLLIAQEIYNVYTEDQFQFDFKGVLDKTLETLKNEKILNKYQNKFKYIIVDEYQDTNFLQKELFDKIHQKGHNYIFYVGDRKQSIYRFRGADVSVFAVTENEFNEDSKFQLNINRRSNAEIVEFANEFSKNVLFNETLLNSYENIKNIYPDIFNNLLYNETKDKSYFEANDENDVIPSIAKEDKHRIKYIISNDEYHSIAKTIKALVGKKLKFRKRKNGSIVFEEREIQYRDIAVLLRELKNSEEEIRKVFKEYKIPFYILGSKSFYDKNEVQTVFYALNAVENPHNDFNFSGYMMSLMVGMPFKKLNKLVNLKKKNNFKSLYETAEKTDILSNSERSGFEILKKYVELKYYLNPTVILKGLISETNYLSRLTVLHDPHYAIANVKKLLNEAEKYNTLAVSFSELIRLLRKTSELSEEEAAIEDEKQNVVKVLTIHKSKGLEFPIVILGGLGKKIDLNTEEKTGDKINVSNEKIEFSLPENNVRYFVLKKLFLKKVKNMDISSINTEDKIKIQFGEKFLNIFDINKFLEDTESLRLLYVAITRPKEMLIPIIPLKNDKNNEKSSAALFMKSTYEKRDLIPENELVFETQEIEEKNEKKLEDINERNLSDLTLFAYKKYIAPTYIINEMKREENSEDLTEEHYIDIKDFFENEDYLLKGTEMHAIMESITNFSQIQSLIKNGNLPKAFDNELIKRLFTAKKVKTEWRLVKRMVFNGIEYMIFGVPDRVIFDENNNIEIIDYKYSDLSNKEKIEDYKFQLNFYMYLLKDFGNPKKGYVISLKNGKIIEVDPDENFEEYLKEIITTI
ncbi:ATP-dependent exoDNAse (exonuclease V) beta subunit (contains helicase and exonuclease domains) [Marinitoga hydrogenitolerans DSM 16785]|uniref:DNA 3'-5' helicase n=1 Tax=Marinitoga hydrogenitolerans (strain DSM 16785 / JCM 12826 / AT1271) TaxID=1122195 RepID=A0A1M4YU50_MARH1|nr:UvrD-helicase domain-containing protein [Marinitoga hydrogenitolerans]SHF09374.1 ATP-dependent exoDNAse (exonuclease V) beta subunit (contains helicase and exonuclease domains) [Marinitoga hydrogenitolerans DSM 16785]